MGNEFFATVEMFCSFTGLCINYDKTQIMRLGSLKDSQAELFTQKLVLWSRRIKILAITFVASKREMIQINCEHVLLKIDNILNNWQTRGITLLGKILVINTLIVPQLLYYFMNMYSPTTEFYKVYDKHIKNFLWEGGKGNIKYETLKKDLQDIGLKLVDIEKKCSALKCKWLSLAVGNNSIWALRLRKVFPLCINDLLDIYCRPQDMSTIGQNNLWYEIIGAWMHYNYKDS